MNSLILIVEDDRNLQETLGNFLIDKGFYIKATSSLKEASEAMDLAPALVILDWNLTDGPGVELVKNLRTTGNRTPVILVSARTDVMDKVLALELGANDYLTKPFDPRELLARIRAQLQLTHPVDSKRGTNSKSLLLVHGDLRVDLNSRQVRFQSEMISLTKFEFDLLAFLIQAPGKVFTRDELLDEIWGYDQDQETRAIDNCVSQLRKKVPGDWLETVRGVGYRIKK